MEYIVRVLESDIMMEHDSNGEFEIKVFNHANAIYGDCEIDNFKDIENTIMDYDKWYVLDGYIDEDGDFDMEYGLFFTSDIIKAKVFKIKPNPEFKHFIHTYSNEELRL